jgi:DNA-binding GntR family transcriptional regulator
MQRREQAAYRRLSAELRSEIEEGRFGDGGRLPTEAELGKEHGVSRHTVRQAFQSLVADGLVYRVSGRGTFVTGLSRRGRYLRVMGSLEEIMSWTGTEMEVIEPIEFRDDADAAARLERPSDEVAALVVRRLYEGLPFVVTHVYLPPEPAKRMRDEGLPANGASTVIGTIERFIPLPVARVSQDITAVPTPADVSAMIDCQPDEAILHAERLYHDANGTPVELAVSHYNPRRYSYRLEMQCSTPP